MAAVRRGTLAGCSGWRPRRCLARPAAGAIAGAVVVLGRRALVDEVTWAIALLTLVLLWRVRRVPEPVLIVGAGLVGLLFPR